MRKFLNSKMLLFSLVVFFSSCNDEFITKEIEYGTQSDVSFRKTLNGLLYTLNASYSPLGGEYWQQYPLNWHIAGEYRTDNAHAGGADENDGVNDHAINDFNIYSTNRIFSEYWRNAYTGIHYANAVIISESGAKSANPLLADQKTIDRYVAEAKCMRAYYYCDLVKQFGGVPILLDLSTVFRKRSSVLEVYDQIEKDLNEAVAVLPKRTELTNNEKGRMNSGSALAILAKAYLFRASVDVDNEQKYFNLAYQTAKNLINSNQFSLMSTFDKIWQNTGDFSTEGIVEGGQPVFGEKATYSSWFSTHQCPRAYYKLGTKTRVDSEWGWGRNQPTQDLVNTFEKGDTRLYWSVFAQKDSSASGNKSSIKLRICFNHSTSGFYSRKYAHEKYQGSNNSLNIKYYRYSDLILVGAEAANEVGQTTDALNWLELIRSRARNTPPATNHKKDQIIGVPIVVSETNKDLLREIIRHERRVELAMEGHRFYDLVRWDGKYGFDWKTVVQTAQAIGGPRYESDDVLPSGAPRFGRTVIVEDKHKLSPIPDTELKSTNNELSQNPGY